LAEGIARLGLDRLPWTRSLAQWRGCVMFLRATLGDDWPDLSDAALTARVDEWLTPALAEKTALADVREDELSAALTGLLPWQLRRRLEDEAPTHYAAPSGSRMPIDYESADGPRLAIRLQELFGLDRHPSIAGGRVPLVLELLSPAPRPGQITRDLPGFWRGSSGAGGAREARQLCGGAHRDARALSAPSVAGRSARRAADAARQAARHVRKRQTDKIVAIPARPRSARRRNSADASLALVNSWTAVWWDDAA